MSSRRRSSVDTFPSSSYRLFYISKHWSDITQHVFFRDNFVFLQTFSSVLSSEPRKICFCYSIFFFSK